MIGFGKGCVHRGFVADQFDEADVVWAVLPHPRRIHHGCVGGRGDRGQRLKIDHDQLGGVQGLGDRLRHDKGNAITDPARTVVRQNRIARHKLGFAIAPFKTPGNGQIAVTETFYIRCGQHSEHAGCAFGGFDVYRTNFSVRMWRAQHYAMSHAGERDVVYVATSAADEPLIFEASYALPD